MITWLLILLGWSDAPALQQTAPRDLPDVYLAAEHLGAARVAGARHEVDPDLLLAIAWRESRYQVNAVMREASGKLSCGLLMVTVPKGRPCPPPSVVAGYLAGAARLREWMKLTRDPQKALLGYAGGYPMIRACEAGGELVRVRGGRAVDLCKTPEVDRAAWIRATRTRMESRSAS